MPRFVVLGMDPERSEKVKQALLDAKLVDAEFEVQIVPDPRRVPTVLQEAGAAGSLSELRKHLPDLGDDVLLVGDPLLRPGVDLSDLLYFRDREGSLLRPEALQVGHVDHGRGLRDALLPRLSSRALLDDSMVLDRRREMAFDLMDIVRPPPEPTYTGSDFPRSRAERRKAKHAARPKPPKGYRR